MTLLRRCLRVVPVLVLLLPCILHAASPAANAPASVPSQAAGQNAPVLKVRSDLVLVDVVVTKNGVPVKGLTEDKFRVLENGKQQELKVFEAHSEAEQPATASNAPATSAPAPKTPALAPNTYSDFIPTPPSSAVNVLLFDTLNTLGRLSFDGGTSDRGELADQANVRKQMLAYLKKIPPGTQLAVFTLDSRLHMAQGFTADPVLLAKAVANKTDINRPAQSDQTMDNRERITLSALRQIAHYLSAIPGRKNLIWFSASFPMLIQRGFYEDVRETDRALAAARIAVYTVDARGLFPPENVNGAIYNATIELPAGGGEMAVLDAEIIRGRQRQASEGIQLADQTIQQVAAETGGKAFVNTNGFQEAIQQALADGANYYTIGYMPQLKDDGQFRKIKVDVNGGYQLAYRDGYYADSPGHGADSGASTMKEAVQFGAPPPSEIPFKVRVIASTDPIAKGFTPTAGPAGADAKALKPPITRYLIDYMVDAHHFTFHKTPDGVAHARLEFTVLAYDAEGKIINVTEHGFDLDLTSEAYAKVMSSGFPEHQEIDLPTGQVFLRVVVHDLGSSRAGATEIPLMVAKN